jgi:hypothetical protein
MGKKKDKKVKKVSAKKEKYAKFKKEKLNVSLVMPDLDEDQTKQKRFDETKIEKFFKFNRSPPPRLNAKVEAKVNKK